MFTGVGKPAPIMPGSYGEEKAYNEQKAREHRAKWKHDRAFRPTTSVTGKVFNKVQQVTSSYGEEKEHQRKMHYADMAKRITTTPWKPADQAKSFPEPRFLKNYGEAMQPSLPDPPTRKGVEEKKEQLKKKSGHEKPWRAVPSTQSSRPVQSVVTKDLARSYRGKV